MVEKTNKIATLAFIGESLFSTEFIKIVSTSFQIKIKH